MSTLTLIRHGQARAFENDPDRLSPLGEEQSRRLGAYWAQSGICFDEVYTGTLERQKATARIVGEHVNLPAPVADPDFNEYHAPAILGVLAPKLAEDDAVF